MGVSRVQIVDENFTRFVEGWSGTVQKRDPVLPIGEDPKLTGQALAELFESQLFSRHLDYQARILKEKNQGFYTIGSAGHEGNAVLGRLLRPTDPSFVHYRSGAFMMERARSQNKGDFVQETLLSFCASSEDPSAGGRHKVWGSKKLWVPPQTSTIASHLPKAVGLAMTIARAKRIQLPLPFPKDSIVCCSFGDGSINHSTAQGALNAAQWVAYQHLPIPILFVCEDNELSISVRTPKGWVQTKFRDQKGFHYIQANGLDLISTYEGVKKAIDFCRVRRQPVFLHLKMLRLLGHAGSDVETEYLPVNEIQAMEAQDPLLRSARLLLEWGVMDQNEILSKYEAIRKEVQQKAQEAASRPKLSSVQEITQTLAPYHSDKVHQEACRADYRKEREQIFGGLENLPEAHSKPRHMAMLLNWALADLLAKYPQMMIFGQDVAKKGGVYHVTAGLSNRFGTSRVFNTLLDEQTILGLAIGAGHAGFLPVPEIQYLAYYHNAEDQIRGEAASLQFFSNGQFQNPMVIRMASFAYQKGFGGHFHNDNSIAALRDVPGVIIACPSRGDDAVNMFRTAMALAQVDGRVVFFLEPIARYMTKDLYEQGDGLWQCKFPPPGEAIQLGKGRVYEPEAKDLTILTYANGVYLSLRAAKRLKQEFGICARILDMRWLAPLPEKEILEQAKATGRVLIVDECRKTGGVAEGIMALLCEQDTERKLHLARLNAEDTYVPLGPAANLVLPSEEQIIKASTELVRTA